MEDEGMCCRAPAARRSSDARGTAKSFLALHIGRRGR
jgi:hypothetical protein